MGFSVEDVPLIPASILAVYSLLRLASVFFKKDKQSIFHYWSRFLFRLFFLVYCVFSVLVNIKSLYKIGNIFAYLQYIGQMFLDVSLVFLVVSLQYFGCYKNRPQTFVKRNWIALTFPFLFALISCQILIIFSSEYQDTETLQIAKMTNEVVFLFFIISLINIPALSFLTDFYEFSMVDSLKLKLNLIRAFFVFQILCLIASSVWTISCEYTSYKRNAFLIFKSSRDPIVMFICFSQDMIDWMFKLVYPTEEDEIDIEDEAESKRVLKKTIEIVDQDV